MPLVGNMETRLHKLIAYIFPPCEWNHTKLTMIIFIDVSVKSFMSLNVKKGHVRSYHENEATLINCSCLLTTVMKSHQNLFNYVS